MTQLTPHKGQGTDARDIDEARNRSIEKMATQVLSERGKEDCMLNRIFQAFLLICLLGGTAWAMDDSMVGDWKLHPQKSELTDMMKVESPGGNKYSFDFGGGDPEVAVADGTDQPGHFGTMIAVRVDAPHEWTFIRKKERNVLLTGFWTLSKDGNTLNDHYTAARPNGDVSSLDYIYRRTGDGSGFAGLGEFE
jgi:hypothetical protein